MKAAEHFQSCERCAEDSYCAEYVRLAVGDQERARQHIYRLRVKREAGVAS